jgi:hypothetical protein
MPCNHVDLGGGARAIVCTRHRQQRCVTCGRPSTVLCDYPVTNHRSGTCDRPCCRQHAVNVGADRDYCLAHAELEGKAK